MSVKCDLSDPSPIFQKDSNAGASQIDITTPKEGKAEIKLVPSDTQTMDVGTYVFDIWVVLASGTRSPVVAPSPFKVVAGVTVLT
jgi:beta-lactamase regulating signal transducer with metallopeptidase domain